MGRPISEWSLVPAENVFDPIDGGHPEGMQRSDVNNSERDNLANVRLWYDAPEWLNLFYINDVQASFVRISATQFTLTSAGVDFTSKFNTARILRIVDGVSAGVDLRTTVVSASYSFDVTTVNIDLETSMDSGASDVLVYFSAELSIDVFSEGSGLFYQPATATAEGINDAIQLASSAGGGIVFMVEGTYTIDAVIFMESNVSLLGTGEGTILRQNDATDLVRILKFEGVNGVYCRDFVIDVNEFNQASLKGNGLTIRNCSNLLFDNVLVKGANICLLIDGTVVSTGIEMRSCRFEDYREQGIKAIEVVGDHTGTIVNCLFATTQYFLSTPAAMFVWGEWKIDNNRIDLTGTATVDNRGIFLWPKTDATNGANNCTVTGNTIIASCDRTTGIEVGGNDCAVSGNVITLEGTVTKGIVVDTPTGGLFIDRVSITGNAIDGATSVGIQLSSDSRQNTVSGNTINATLLAIDVTGNDNMITVNTISGATNGVRFNAGATGNSFISNGLHDITSTLIDDLGTDTKLWDNTEDVRLLVTYVADHQIDNSGGDHPVTGLTGLTLPGHGLNGVRDILVSVRTVIELAGDGTLTFKLFIGDAGDITDTLFRTYDFEQSETGYAYFSSTDLIPGSTGEFFSLGYSTVAIQNGPIRLSEIYVNIVTSEH